MKESIYKSYDELPLFLNAEIVSKLLGISPSSGYELMRKKRISRAENRLTLSGTERKIPQVGGR